VDVTSTILAAGGVVTRRGERGDTEMLVVHRPRYGDWSFPKGKLDPGEDFEAAARREVAEESGIVAELGRELAPAKYLDRHGRPKLVRYWHMTPRGVIPWEANDEVDEVRWITAAEAATLLSYDGDLRLLAEVVGELSGGTG
jgi:8-oxo-dGTP diphosphatase